MIGIARQFQNENDYVKFHDNEYAFLYHCCSGTLWLGGNGKYSLEPSNPGATVGVLVDMEEGKLQFITNGERSKCFSSPNKLLTGEYFITVVMREPGDQVQMMRPGPKVD